MPTRTTTAIMNKDTGPSAIADDFPYAAPARTAKALAARAYTTQARTLHWITAVLIFLMIPTGFIAANEWGGPLQDSLYDLHKSIGALIIPIVVVRLVYRWRHPPLPLPADVPRLQRLAAEATHWALYALLVLQPLIGWIATSAYPAPVPVFGWATLPPIWPADRALSEQLFSVHRLVGIAIACLVTAHVAGALHHHFMRRDRVLMRMISG